MTAIPQKSARELEEAHVFAGLKQLSKFESYSGWQPLWCLADHPDDRRALPAAIALLTMVEEAIRHGDLENREITAKALEGITILLTLEEVGAKAFAADRDAARP